MRGQNANQLLNLAQIRYGEEKDKAKVMEIGEGYEEDDKED